MFLTEYYEKKVLTKERREGWQESRKERDIVVAADMLKESIFPCQGAIMARNGRIEPVAWSWRWKQRQS